MDDFASAFLQAGIPPNELDHPSICGLFRKCTTALPKGTHCTVALIVCMSATLGPFAKLPTAVPKFGLGLMSR